MKEFEFIKSIQTVITSPYIGDDCAYLEDLGIVLTQDSLVENVHFRLDLITPYQLGFKSVMVNLSDIYASGAEAEYLTIALSLPKDLNTEFVKEFYKGAKSACKNVKIVGGDITGSEKLFISVCAIGTTKNRKISSRKNASVGQKIISTGEFGSAAGGLELLLNNNTDLKNLIKSHLEPIAKKDFSNKIATSIKTNYAMMDTSDGLMDTLFKIAEASNVLISVDFDKIPFNNDLKVFDDYKNKILFGAEDYNLVATVPESLLSQLKSYNLIGEVKSKTSENLVEIIYKNKTELFDENKIKQYLFNHFTT